MDPAFAIPLWLKLAYAAGVPVIVVVYWRTWGPKNFLWFSDIALFCTAGAVLTGNSLLASMPAVGVLPLEIAWTLDFLTRGRLGGLSAYMFDVRHPLYLRALSLFHLAIPPTLVYLLYGLGYDSRALWAQTLLIWLVLPLTYAAKPVENINWVFGLFGKPQTTLPPLVYLGLEMIVWPLIVVLPMHLILVRVF